MDVRAIDPTSDRPVYRQIADHLRDDITAGRLLEGERLPSESQLMGRYGTARNTARDAIALLRAEGLVEVHHGRGAFVRRRPPLRRLTHDRFTRRHRKTGKAAFLAEAAAEGWEPTVEILDIGPAPATGNVAERLGVEEGSTILRRYRRYLADGRPVEIAATSLPLDVVEGTTIAEPNPGPGGVHARLEEAGHRLAYLTEDVTARMPTPDETKLLRLPPGTPVLHLVREAHTKDRVVEVTETVIAADRYVLSYRLPAS